MLGILQASLLLNKRDSSFDVVRNAMQGYRIATSTTSRDYITNKLRPLWKTAYIQYRKEVELMQHMSNDQ